MNHGNPVFQHLMEMHRRHSVEPDRLKQVVSPAANPAILAVTLL